jgi:hypothetical protein
MENYVAAMEKYVAAMETYMLLETLYEYKSA